MNQQLLQKLRDYHVPKEALTLIQKTQVAFLVGVTGAGKDTIRKRLLAMGDYHHIVSHTSRSPRRNHGVLEQDGVDYHFIDHESAEAMLDQGGFVEAKVYSGNVYGTSVAEIKMAHDEGKIAISDIEVQGVAEYRSVADNIIPIFLLPPDFDTWQARLKKRYQDDSVDPKDIAKRIATAATELREALRQDYFEFVINDDLEATVRVVNEIAHGNLSDKKNAQARAVAENLLLDVEKSKH